MAYWREDIVASSVQSFDERESFLVIRAQSGSSNGSLLRLLRWKARMSSTDGLLILSKGHAGLPRKAAPLLEGNCKIP